MHMPEHKYVCICKLSNNCESEQQNLDIANVDVKVAGVSSCFLTPHQTVPSLFLPHLTLPPAPLCEKSICIFQNLHRIGTTLAAVEQRTLLSRAPHQPSAAITLLTLSSCERYIKSAAFLDCLRCSFMFSGIFYITNFVFIRTVFCSIIIKIYRSL